MNNRSQHTVTQYLSDGKLHAASNSELFKKLDYVNKSLYEVEIAKAQIEHKEPFIIAFINVQYVKLRMLKLYHKILTKFCDVNRFEELEMDTCSLYRAVAEKELEGYIRLELKTEWERLRWRVYSDRFTADAPGHFIPRLCCGKQEKHDKKEPALFKEEFNCTETVFFCGRTYFCYDIASKKSEFSGKSLYERAVKQSGDGP